MKNFSSFGFCCCLLLLLTFGAAGPVAAGKQASKSKVRPIICAISNYYECLPAGGCQAKSAVELEAPAFFKILLDKKEIMLLGQAAGNGRVSKIKVLDQLGDTIILQGMESGSAKRRSGVGWTISINEKTGAMVLTVSSGEAGYVGMGMCTAY